MENEIILTVDDCCDTIPCDCGTLTPAIPAPDMCQPCSCEEPVMQNIEEKGHNQFVQLAAVLQESIMYSWKLHLKAKKYSVHVILEEYYDEAFDIIDGLIEHYQGICKCDIIDNDNVITANMDKSGCPIAYFTDLKNYLTGFVNDTNNFSEKTLEIKSDIDDLLRLIDSTLYKLGNLSESKIKSFRAFVYENNIQNNITK